MADDPIATVPLADVQLLLSVVRSRFLASSNNNAIILALEGLKWLTGDTDTVVTRQSLEAEQQDWANSKSR